jgi:hypothetical protein
MTSYDNLDRKLSQHQRILEKAQFGWMCQCDFWQISKSPHKRRADIVEGKYTELDGSKGTPHKYRWDERPCEHGIAASKDFLIIPRPTGRLF